MKIWKLIAICFTALLLPCGCNNDEDEQSLPPTVEPAIIDGTLLSVTICISEETADTRVVGEPGYVEYPLPNVMMAYLINDIDDTLYPSYDSIAYYQFDIGAENWSMEPYYKTIDGELQLLYRYIKTVNITLPTEQIVDLYCIFATDTLVLPGSTASSYPTLLPNTYRKSDIQNLMCNRSDLPTGLSLYDIYSGWTTTTINNEVASCRIVASHIASKIDVIYNVADSMVGLTKTSPTKDVRVTGLVLKNTTQNGFFFKKRSNTLAECTAAAIDTLFMKNDAKISGSSYNGRFSQYLFMRDYAENNIGNYPLTYILLAKDTLNNVVFKDTLLLSLPATRTTDNLASRLAEESAYLRYDLTIGGTKSGTYTLEQSGSE